MVLGQSLLAQLALAAAMLRAQSCVEVPLALVGRPSGDVSARSAARFLRASGWPGSISSALVSGATASAARPRSIRNAPYELYTDASRSPRAGSSSIAVR